MSSQPNRKAGSGDGGLGTGMIHVLANVYCNSILKLLATAEAQQNKQDHSAKYAITMHAQLFYYTQASRLVLITKQRMIRFTSEAFADGQCRCPEKLHKQ